MDFPIEEMEHAIALCGWTAASQITPQSNEVRRELRRLESLGALDIPDGRRWFKMFGKPLQPGEMRPDPGPRMGEDNYRDGDGEGYIP